MSLCIEVSHQENRTGELLYVSPDLSDCALSGYVTEGQVGVQDMNLFREEEYRVLVGFNANVL